MEVCVTLDTFHCGVTLQTRLCALTELAAHSEISDAILNTPCSHCVMDVLISDYLNRN